MQDEMALTDDAQALTDAAATQNGPEDVAGYPAFQLGRDSGDGGGISLKLHMDQFGAPVNPEDPKGRQVFEIEFGLRPLNGRDQRVIGNVAQRTDKKGITWIQNGEVQREIVCRAVTWIRGLRDERGNPIVRMNYEVADKLLKWWSDAIVNKVVEIESEDSGLLGE